MHKILLLVFVAIGVAQSSKIGTSLQNHLSLNQHHNNGVDILISIKGSISAVLDTLALQKFNSRTEKLNTVTASLKRHAELSQAPVVALLESKSVSFTSFWVNNQIVVKGATTKLIHELGQHETVNAINLDERIPLEGLNPVPSDNTVLAEWGVQDIKADLVWAHGVNGTGARVAVVATGARSTHEALIGNFMGPYGWFDPYSNTAVPIDQNGLGTFTVGMVAGSGGIGVAPGASWQACRGCDSVACSNSALIACGQWALCPTLWDGTSPDCDKAPHVVVSAWGSGGGSTFYDEIIRLLRFAEIAPVFGVGAGGGACGSVGSPGDSRDGVLAVGSYTQAHVVTSGSGPSVHGQLKPDMVGPGASIRSAWSTSDNSYSTLSSTGNGPAHVTGAYALLKGNDPDLNYDDIYSALATTAEPVTSNGQTCGGIPDTIYPNNAAGYGKVNVLAAYLLNK